MDGKDKMSDMRSIVKKGYNEGNYEKHFRSTSELHRWEKFNLDKFLNLISPNANILDLGSGTGIPFDKLFVQRGHTVTGIDISQKHVDIAKKNVPEATYIKGDFSNYNFKNKFDAIVSLYAIFHIPREEHAELFQKIHSLLKDKGIILVTMGAKDLDQVESEFVGSTNIWSSYAIKENIELIKHSGFSILSTEEENNGKEHHLWIVAQK